MKELAVLVLISNSIVATKENESTRELDDRLTIIKYLIKRVDKLIINNLANEEFVNKAYDVRQSFVNKYDNTRADFIKSLQ